MLTFVKLQTGLKTGSKLPVNPVQYSTAELPHPWVSSFQAWVAHAPRLLER